MSAISKFFTGAAVSAARSLLLSQVKGNINALIKSTKVKSIADIQQEMIKHLGYTTSHYVVAKNTQEISYKPSAVFMHEWLTNSPLVKERIVRDEESGHVYVDGELISNSKKVDLINRFINSTGIKVSSVSSHMENALKLIDLSDFNASKFEKFFEGWNPENASVIDVFMDNCFGPLMVTEPLYTKNLFRKWIIGSARRAITPGTGLDGCLTFTGPAGTGKTAFFRNLLPEPFDARTGEILCNVRNPQKFVESIKGKTVACFDELSVLDYARSLETFKQLLSSNFIDVRLAWAREPRRYDLRQGFSATTNKAKFIPDPFFSRRLWTIELNNNGRLNFDYLFSNRMNLWREAVYCAKQKESCILSVEEQRLVETNNVKYLK